MTYTFEILGVSPVLYFFNHQQEVTQKEPQVGVEYLGTPKCTLDALIESVETLPPHRGWDYNQLVKTVVDFWINHPDSISLWKDRLQDAGKENLLVSRVGSMKSFRQEFESLLRK